MGYQEENEKALQDSRVAAIRADSRVGRGTCTYIDESFEHTEILEGLNDDGIVSDKDAVAWAHQREGLIIENGTNASSGEADCPLVARHREWNGE